MHARLSLLLACVVSVTFLASLTSCGPTHTGPSDGVILYEHPDYKGDSIGVTFDQSELDVWPGPCGGSGYPTYGPGDWDDCVSSVRVPAGWEAVLYEHERYRGETLTVTSDVSDLEDVAGPCGDDWDDCVSSIRVFRN
jgi:hypothetical protein